MGDTGTLSVGLLLAITLLKFDDVNTLIPGSPYQFHSAPGLAFGFISIPFVDSARVAIVRLMRGVSPLKGDKNHIHHLFLRLGWKQNQVALFIGSMLVLILATNFVLDHFYWSSWGIILIDLIIIATIYLIIFFALRKLKQ
jgi:UDP-N-acetylmuramyl pentapeptide phosphotransferase/UDP-N-acetylglucosamine-1-phosphate transferase